MVMFLYRPEYYDISTNEFGESNKGETHVRIAKHRNGSLETIKLRALLHIQKFIEDDFDTPPGMSFPGGGNFRPVTPEEGSRVFVQKGSKMNDASFDEEITF
jgi:replicative DNA helicase